MHISLLKFKKSLIIASSLLFISGIAGGTVIYTQYLSQRNNTAPTPSEAEQNACYLEFGQPQQVSLSGGTYCVHQDTGMKEYIGNIPIRLIQNDVETIVATSDVSGIWNATLDYDLWTNPVGSLRPNGGTEFPDASATDEYTGRNNGITCTDSNVEGVSFNSDRTAIVELVGCARPNIPINQVNFNLGYCPQTPPPPPEELSCVSLTAQPTSGVAPLTVNFTAVASNPSLVTSYRFTFGDGQTATQTGTTVSHIYSSNGTYTATVQMQKADGTWTPIISACTVIITVTTTPPPPEELSCVSLTASPTSGNYPLTVRFTAQSSNNNLVDQYRFTFGDGNIVYSSTNTITHTYEEAGTYSARVQMRSAANDLWTPVISACTVTITVTSPPPPPPADLTCTSLTATPLSGDYPLTVNFTALASAPLRVEQYRFIFGDGEEVLTSTATATHTYQEEGTYIARVRMQDANGNWTPDITACRVTITVKTPPAPPAEFSCLSLASTSTSGQTPLTVTFTASANIPSRAEQYRFYFGDGESQTTTNPSVTHTYDTDDTFDAYVLIKDSLDGWTTQVARCSLDIFTQTPPNDELVCNSVCSLENDQCPSTYKCIGLGTENRCRNATCSGESDCTCGAAPETPQTPVSPSTPAQPQPLVVPETGNIGKTLQMVGAGLLLLILGLIL